MLQIIVIETTLLLTSRHRPPTRRPLPDHSFRPFQSNHKSFSQIQHIIFIIFQPFQTMQEFLTGVQVFYRNSDSKIQEITIFAQLYSTESPPFFAQLYSTETYPTPVFCPILLD